MRYAPQVAEQKRKVSAGELAVRPYREIISNLRIQNAKELSDKSDTVGSFFDIFYGQKELHSRDGIPPGDSPVVSPTEQYNGTYGWLWFEPLIAAPFVTVAQTGTIGEAFVQLEPCAVNDDCLVLLPREGKLPMLFITAAIIRLERWRFTYGRKLTPSRICSFPMQRMPHLEAWVAAEIERWAELWESAVGAYLNGGSVRVGARR